MFGLLKRIFLGAPIPTSRMVHERLSKFLALPVFSSDALSSVAYGTEEVLITLALVGFAVWNVSLPIGIAIAALIAIVSISYRQTIFAYPQGGGSYRVAKDNLGTPCGLVAAASILTDYVLTVAVSTAAGIQAIVALYPSVAEFRVFACIAAVLIVTFANLRGLRESGAVFAPPTYGFVICIYILIIAGFIKIFSGAPINHVVPLDYKMPAFEPLGLFVILRAFSSGCSALTGIEAIADGVPAFKKPESKNAAATMTIMAIMLASMVLGVTYLAHAYHPLPGTFIEEHGLRNIPNYNVLVHQTTLAQLADKIFGRGIFYYVLQIATATVLILAANTAFQDFPRLSSILARDRFAPRQLMNIGDRLVFSNGIFLLSLFAIFLLVIFRGKTNALIPLYAVGVFISFTLSQVGMGFRIKKLGEKNWRMRMGISLAGGFITGIVALIISITKFTHGAYIIVIWIPALVFVFHKIHQHYIDLGNQLRINDDEFSGIPSIRSTAIVLTSSIHKGVLPALEYAKTLSHDCRALYIEIDPVETSIIRDKWEKYGFGIPLVIIESPYRTVLGPLFKYLEYAKKERSNHIVTVVVPEFVPKKFWHRALHNQQAFILKLLLMFRKDIVVTYVRFYLDK